MIGGAKAADSSWAPSICRGQVDGARGFLYLVAVIDWGEPQPASIRPILKAQSSRIRRWRNRVDRRH